ncbi:MAG: lantibiotic dehydratase [Kibdelosporangium sp.]
MTGPQVAPFALVRLAALNHPAPVVGDFRTAMNALVTLEAKRARLAPSVADALYSSASGHSAAFHRRVVLPLRRSIHNGRLVRSTDLGDLPDQVPLLREWLREQDSFSSLSETVLEHWPSALTAERAVLTELCASEPLRRAVVLTGRDLLHGIDRIASGSADRKTRKIEATVLRYALRASSKTSPLSWYTYVGWGRWDEGDTHDQEPVARTHVNQVLLARLTASLLDVRQDSVPHRCAPGLRERDGRISFYRDIPVPGTTRAYVTKEELVDVAATEPLRFVLDAMEPKGTSPADLVRMLARRLPAQQVPAASKFVHRLLDIGLLVPIAPVDPQNPDGARALAEWLRDRAEAGLADQLTGLADDTESFAALDPADRPARLTALSAGWTQPDVTPVVEDVVLPKVVRLDRSGMDTLARLTPLMMAFDRQLLIRRIARDRFVDQFGAGGQAHPAECTELMSEALLAALTGPVSTGLLEIQARLGDGEEITDEMIRMAEDLVVPSGRPVSYSWFVQRSPDGLVVNHCYSGFTRFASRFLHQLPPAARQDVDAYLAGIFQDGFMQFRPVGGFTANLQPKLGQEIGEDPQWSDLTPDDLVASHDPATDELRLMYQGRPVNVLYLGFLMPLMLPDRVTALYTDLSCGWPDLDALRSTVDHGGVIERGRLRYRDVMLARRSWEFASPPPLGQEAAVALAVARLRGQYGIAEHVFIAAGNAITSMADFEERLNAPKPQYVDLGNPLHLRSLPKSLGRHSGPVELTEAWPVPSGRVVELIAETWWRAS